MDVLDVYKRQPQMLGTRSTYADIAATAATAFGVPLDTPVTDLFEKIKR